MARGREVGKKEMVKEGRKLITMRLTGATGRGTSRVQNAGHQEGDSFFKLGEFPTMNKRWLSE